MSSKISLALLVETLHTFWQRAFGSRCKQHPPNWCTAQTVRLQYFLVDPHHITLVPKRTGRHCCSPDPVPMFLVHVPDETVYHRHVTPAKVLILAGYLTFELEGCPLRIRDFINIYGLSSLNAPCMPLPDDLFPVLIRIQVVFRKTRFMTLKTPIQVQCTTCCRTGCSLIIFACLPQGSVYEGVGLLERPVSVSLEMLFAMTTTLPFELGVLDQKRPHTAHCTTPSLPSPEQRPSLLHVTSGPTTPQRLPTAGRSCPTPL